MSWLWSRSFLRSSSIARTSSSSSSTSTSLWSSLSFSRNSPSVVRAPPSVASPTTSGWMPMIMRGMASQRHKRLLKHAKGYVGRAKNCFTIAIRRVEKSWQHAYRDRKLKRRNMRTLWIQRCNAGVRQYDWKYSQFIPSLEQAQIQLNRKTLSQLAQYEPFAFKSVVQVVEHEVGGKPKLIRTN